MSLKKPVRWLLIGVAVVCLLLVALVIVALNAGVQKSVTMHFLQQQDPQAKVDSVSFGLSGGEVHGLALTVGGAKIQLGTATVQYSFANLLFGHPRVIDSIQVKDFVYDASQPTTSSKPTASPAASPGATVLPPPILIKKADIAGMVLLPNQRTVQLTLSTQNLGAGGDGQATASIVFQDKSPDAKVTEMRTDAKVSLALDDTMLPKNLDFLADLAATLPGQAEASKLEAHLQAKPANLNSGTFTLTLGPAGTGAAQLASLTGNYGIDGSGSGEFSANLTRAQIEPFAMGIKLPDFNLQSKGEFSADATKQMGSIKATLSGNAGNLAVVRPELAGMGTVQINAAVDATYTAGNLSAKTFLFTLAPEGGQPAIALELLKPTTMQFDKDGVKLPPGAGANLAKLTLTQVPAAWLTAALPKGLAATGEGFNGQVTISARDDGAVVADTTLPLTFAGLHVQQDATTLLDGGDLQCDASVQYLGKALTAQVRKFYFEAHSATAGGVTLNSVSLPGKILITQFAGNVSMTPGATANAAPQINATGRLAVGFDIDQLDNKAFGKTLPPITPLGLLTLDATLDVAYNYPTAVLNSLQVSLKKGPTAQPTVLAAIATQQKISIPLGTDAALPIMSGNLATIDINALPMAFVQASLPATMHLSGNPLKGKLLISGASGTEAGLVLQTTEPLTVDSVRYAEASVPKLTGITIAISPNGSWQKDNISGNVHVLVSSAAGNLLEATLNATQLKDTLSATVTANGRLGAIASQPFAEDWRDFLPDPKPEYSLSANVSRSPEALTIQSADVRVVPSGAVGAALADAKLDQAFTLKTEQVAATATTPASVKYSWPSLKGEVFAIKLTDLPAGVLGLALPGYQLQGRNISGDVVVQGAGDGNYTLVTNAPITAAGLSVAQLTPGKTLPDEMVHDLTFSFKPAATFSQAGLTAYSAQSLTLTSGNVSLALGSFDVANDPKNTWPQHVKINLQADVAQLLAQPVLKKFNNLKAGQVKIDGEMAADGGLTLNADVLNWAVLDSATTLTRMTFENATGKINRDTGALQLSVPVKGASGTGPTDCVLAFSLDPSTTGRKFSLSLTGNNLVVDDLLAVKAGLFPPAPASPVAVAAPAPKTVAKPAVAPAKTAVAKTPATPATPATSTATIIADKVPVWGDLQGTAQVQLKTLRLSSMTIDNLQANAQVSPTQAVLSGVTGNLQGAPLSLNGTLAFDAKQAAPYKLQTSLDFKNFDVGAYFRSRNANATPPVEGKFSINGVTSGTGANIDDLIDQVQFDFKLNSDSGTFHLLDTVANKVGISTGAAKNIAVAAGAVLSILGKKDPTGLTSQVAGSSASAVADLVTNLDAFQYNKFLFEAQRGADLNVKLSQFNVQNTLMQLVGTGQITYVRGTAIPDQALNATLSLNTKGSISQLMQSAHLLGSGSSSGYTQGPQFQIGGTLQHPDYNALYQILAKAAIGTAAGLLH